MQRPSLSGPVRVQHAPMCIVAEISAPVYLDSRSTPLYITMTALGEATIKPGLNSDTRMKPFPFANGHGRYTAVTPEQAFSPLGNGRGTCPL